MKSKLFKNLSFVIGVIAIILSIGIFNFITDPYKVFMNKGYMQINQIPRDYYHIMLKAYRNIPYDTLFLGSSNIGTLFSKEEAFSYYFNKLDILSASYKEQYELLNDYLYFHPETKNVFVFLCYSPFLYVHGTPMPKRKGKLLNLNELFFLLFSKETTEKSIFEFRKKLHTQNHSEQTPLPQRKDYSFSYNPTSLIDGDSFRKPPLFNYKEFNLYYFKKIIDLLKEKNINFIIVIPPYHTIYSAIINDIPHMKETINELKRLCVKVSDNDVYDFSIMNKYNSSGFFTDNYLFSDFEHPNFILGMKIFKVLHDNFSEENLYIKLNKQNIEKNLQYQSKLLSEYYANNRDLIDKSSHRENPSSPPDPSKVVNVTFENAPDYITKEIDSYIEKYKKINDLQMQGTPIKKGVWENKI